MLNKSLVRFSVYQKCLYSTEAKIGIIGVPFAKGGMKRGAVNEGPDALRKGGLIEQLNSLQKYKVIDYGDIQYKINEAEVDSVPNMKNYHHMVCCNRELSKTAEKLLREGHICLALGGDHSIAIGTVDAHIKVKKDICVLYIDAHADINTNKTSSSGNVHGMPIAILASELSDYWPNLPGMDWQKPMLSLKNVAYIGLRSVDPYERLVIQKLGVTAFDMADVEKHGIHSVAEMALKAVDPDGSRSIHVSFDIDALDSLEAPSTVIPCGITLREGVQIMELVHDTGRLGAMDIVEVNPGVGDERDVKRTVNAAVQIVTAAFGNKRRGFKPANVDTLPLQTFPPTRPEIK